MTVHPSTRVLTVFLAIVVMLAPLAGAGPSNQNEAKRVQAKCVKVIDGDTLVLNCDSGKQTVDLVGIDAPELDQPWGKQIRHFLRQTVKGESVEVVMVSSSENQHVARVYVNGEDLSRSLAAKGLAWAVDGPDRDDEIHQLADKARNTPAGLWLDDNPQPPWEFRAS